MTDADIRNAVSASARNTEPLINLTSEKLGILIGTNVSTAIITALCFFVLYKFTNCCKVLTGASGGAAGGKYADDPYDEDDYPATTAVYDDYLTAADRDYDARSIRSRPERLDRDERGPPPGRDIPLPGRLDSPQRRPSAPSSAGGSTPSPGISRPPPGKASPLPGRLDSPPRRPSPPGEKSGPSPVRASPHPGKLDSQQRRPSIPGGKSGPSPGRASPLPGRLDSPQSPPAVGLNPAPGTSKPVPGKGSSKSKGPSQPKKPKK